MQGELESNQNKDSMHIVKLSDSYSHFGISHSNLLKSMYVLVTEYVHYCSILSSGTFITYSFKRNFISSGKGIWILPEKKKKSKIISMLYSNAI